VVTGWYLELLDTEAYTEHTANNFIVLLSEDPNGTLAPRRIQEATVLLGYSPGHIVDWADLEGSSTNLSVWPEEGIVPTNPVQTMNQPGGTGCFAGTGLVCSSGGHNDVQVASGKNGTSTGGVFRREFKSCYNQGVAFGACAVIMNDTSAPITVQSSWLTQSYGHQITMNGGDVQSGGTVNLTGSSFSPSSTTIPADDALLLAP